MIGKKFGMLTIIGNDNERKGYVICKCDCGKTKSIRKTSLTKKRYPTTSCGCKQSKLASKIGKKTIHKNSEKQIQTNLAYNTNIQVIKTEKPPKNNTSGHKGVSWSKEKKSWYVYIQLHGKRIRLGYYKDKEQAVQVREKAEKEFYQPILEKALTKKQ